MGVDCARHAGSLNNYPADCLACSPIMDGAQLTPVSAVTVCGRWQWSLDHDTLVSPVAYVIYFQVIGTSADADTLINISQTSIDHRILIEFHKRIINY